MQQRFESLPETKLIGLRITMSFANNKTGELWRTFMPRRNEVDSVGDEFYSVEIYDDDFFINFNPSREFEKWAAVKVEDNQAIPDGMSSLVIPEGLYSVFNYKGKSSDAANAYEYIFRKWVPESEYEVDNRPHFALMGEKYKNDHPDSEEELWIPIR